MKQVVKPYLSYLTGRKQLESEAALLNVTASFRSTSPIKQKLAFSKSLFSYQSIYSAVRAEICFLSRILVSYIQLWNAP